MNRDIKNSKYLKFIDFGLELAKRVPRYFSKFSKKTYNNHQHVVLLVLKQKLRTTYRDLIEWIKINDQAKLLLGLFKVPHYSTLIKFAKRIKPYVLGLLLYHRKAKAVAVDASGFELEQKSYYYRTAWNSDRKLKTRKFLKLSIAIDTENQKVLTYKIRKSCRHDTLDFPHLVKKLKTKYVFADKGYDSKKNRQLVLNKLKAMPIIPVRRYTKFYGYLRGGKKIDGSTYHQRSKVETAFSVIKRKFGSNIRARSINTQKIELISKIIAYNVDKATFYKTLIIRGFHQSLESSTRKKC